MRTYVVVLTVLMLFCLPGCVERLITVQSDPPGAIVWLNGEEVGATPVTTSFTWYGAYDVVIRKDGYETLKTMQETPIPFYQWPGIDFVSECLLPFTFTDHHEWDFELKSQEPVSSQELIDRATSLRDETLATP